MMSFIDKDFLLSHLFNVILYDSPDLVMVKSIGNDRHPLIKYIKLYLYIPGMIGGQKKKV
jgi:hypothetical protein